MLGPIAKKYMFKGYEAGIWFFTVPFEWETKEKERVIPAKSKLRVFRLYDNGFYQIVGIVWCGIRAFQLSETSHESNKDLANYIIAMIFGGGLIFPACLYFNFGRARDELVTFAYDFVEYGTQFQEKFVLPLELARQRSKAHDSSGMFIASLWYIQMIVFSSVGPMTIVMHDIPLLLTGTFNFPDFIQYPLIVIQAIVIFTYVTTWYINQSIYAFPAIEYVSALAYMLKEMKIDQEKEIYTTRSSLRSGEEFILNYRAIQVLHAKAMYIYAPLVLPANEWSYIFLTTYFIFGAFRLEGILSILFWLSALLLLYYLFVAFLLFSQIHTASASTLESWQKQKQSLWIEKALKSMKPISVTIGGYYFVDHGMMLQMYRSIFEGAADLLMI